MATEVVKDHDVILAQGRDQNLLDAGAESLAIDRPVDHPRGGDRIMAQGGDERQGVPVPEGSLADQTLAARRPCPQRGHVGFRRSPLGLNQWRLQWLTLVNEDKALQVNPALMGFPPQALAGNVRPVLRTGGRGFLKLRPSAWAKFHIV